MSRTEDTRRTGHPVASGVAALVCGCLCVSLTACSGGGADDDNEFNPVSASTSSPQFAAPGAELASPAPRSSSESGPLSGSQPLDVLPEEGTQMTISEVRAASHGTFERIVIELEGDGSPGWFVTTDDEPAADGSGAPIDYDGDTALVIDVRGLEMSESSTDVPVKKISTDLIESVEAKGVFEGSQRIVVGLGEDNPDFTLNVLDSPTRIVVDILKTD
ncbi:AMIN-like domain-containing (lipo)protein [Corynebacterium sp. AOP40-9SA-29]|uniref:AMIN-like domain-containing (lipo)protein n=1 Tax=Corynebacterium sp. AOP40-9SA-29 TaxID=3457677 RepID=UPI004034F20C